MISPSKFQAITRAEILFDRVDFLGISTSAFVGLLDVINEK